MVLASDSVCAAAELNTKDVLRVGVVRVAVPEAYACAGPLLREGGQRGEGLGCGCGNSGEREGEGKHEVTC